MRQAIAAAVLFCAFGAPLVHAETAVERGKYLVETIAGCGNCHTPQGPNGPVAARALAGGFVVDDNPAFKAISSNITPDREDGIGAWTDDQIVRAIREGIRPDGTLVGPPMPIELYRGIADSDVRAMVAYLRTVPPLKGKAEKSTYHIPLPPSYGPPVGHVEAPPRSDKVAYGAYLAGPVGHCIECHSPRLPDGQRDAAHTGAGGMAFAGPWGTSMSANITPNRDRGLGAWSDAEIERAIRTGVSKDGRHLLPPMGYAYYRGISSEDMAALIAYLRSLPPQQ